LCHANVSFHDLKKFSFRIFRSATVGATVYLNLRKVLKLGTLSENVRFSFGKDLFKGMEKEIMKTPAYAVSSIFSNLLYRWALYGLL